MRAELEHTPWGRAVPWVTTLSSLVVLVALAWFLIENILWFRLLAFPVGSERDANFTLYAFHLHLAMIKRSVALFAGFALIFVGTAVAFYTLRLNIELDAQSPSIGGRLRTASPGVVAMLLGTVLIMFTIYSKDSFDALPEAENTQTPTFVLPDVPPQ